MKTDLIDIMRPRKYEDVWGCAEHALLLRDKIKNKRLQKLHIFGGPVGTGKSTLAEITALALTCEHPLNGEPCLECETCKSNLENLSTGSYAGQIIKINAPRLTDKKAGESVIKEIFDAVHSKTNNTVFIIEEAHKLPKDTAEMILEDFSSMRENIYLFMCTSKYYSLDPGIKSRGVPVLVKPLSDNEALEFAEYVCTSNQINCEELILKKIIYQAKNTPRDITKLIEYLTMSGTIDENIANRVLNASSEVELVDILYTARYGDSFKYISVCEEALDKNLTGFAYSLRDFCLEVSKWYWNSKHKTLNTFSSDTFNKLGKFTEGVSLDMWDMILKFCKDFSIDSKNSGIYSLLELRSIIRSWDNKQVGRRVQEEISVVNTQSIDKSLVLDNVKDLPEFAEDKVLDEDAWVSMFGKSKTTIVWGDNK